MTALIINAAADGKEVKQELVHVKCKDWKNSKKRND